MGIELQVHVALMNPRYKLRYNKKKNKIYLSKDAD